MIGEFPKVGEIYDSVVVKVYPNYAILLLENGYTALLHISEVTDSFIHSFSSYVTVGNIYTVKVIEANPVYQNIKVSRRKISAEELAAIPAKQPINPKLIDFRKLEDKLPIWIQDEIKKENL